MKEVSERKKMEQTVGDDGVHELSEDKPAETVATPIAAPPKKFEEKIVGMSGELALQSMGKRARKKYQEEQKKEEEERQRIKEKILTQKLEEKNAKREEMK